MTPAGVPPERRSGGRRPSRNAHRAQQLEERERGRREKPFQGHGRPRFQLEHGYQLKVWKMNRSVPAQSDRSFPRDLGVLAAIRMSDPCVPSARNVEQGFFPEPPAPGWPRTRPSPTLTERSGGLEPHAPRR